MCGCLSICAAIVQRAGPGGVGGRLAGWLRELGFCCWELGEWVGEVGLGLGIYGVKGVHMCVCIVLAEERRG